MTADHFLRPGLDDLERAAAEHWQAADRAALGGWLLRAAGGFTGRANSALPVGDPGRPLGAAVDAVTAWYGSRGLPAMIVVPQPLPAAGGPAADPAGPARGTGDSLDGLLAAPWQAFATLMAGGQATAIGRVSVAAGWAGITAVEVAAGHRRQGLGTAVTAALARAAAKRGVDRVFLQVEEDNSAARALYARCGFRDAHTYHYRVAPAAPR